MLAMGVDPGPSRTGYNRVDGVLEPRGGGATHAWVSETDLRQVYKISRWKFHNLVTAIEVLKHPRQVWQALRQVGAEEVLGYAYVGSPRSLRDDKGLAYPLPAGKVFIVFLDSRMTVLEWRTEILPEGGFTVGERFKELVWGH